MYASGHMITGALVGTVAGSPLLASLAGFISHAVFDAVPHHDYRKKRYVALDLLVGTATLYILHLLAYSQTPITRSPIILGSLAAALPDIEIVISYLLGKKRKWPPLYPSHSGLTPHGHLSYPWGFWLQAVIMVLSIGGILIRKGLC